jgi:hypothetical protein
MAMIDSNVHGRVYVEPQTRRDQQVRAWKGHHQGPGNDRVEDKRKDPIDIDGAQEVQETHDGPPVDLGQRRAPAKPYDVKDGNLEGLIQVELDLSDSDGN